MDRSEARNRRVGDEGWVSYVVGGDNAHLTEEQRRYIERERALRQRRRGRLLAVVEVRVYEHDTEPQVSFPPTAVLEPGSDEGDILRTVQRAQEALSEWH